MPSYNKVILMGHLTRDPETRTMPNGTAICKIGLAVNHDYKAADGTKKSDVLFIDCDAFGKTAEIMQKYLAKGRACLVEGRLKLDQWDDKETGQKRSRHGVVVENVQFVGGRDDASEPATASAPKASQSPSVAPKSKTIDDDVPF